MGSINSSGEVHIDDPDDFVPVMDWRPLVYGALISTPFWIGLCIWFFT